MGTWYGSLNEVIVVTFHNNKIKSKGDKGIIELNITPADWEQIAL